MADGNWLYRFSSPAVFYPLAGRLAPWFLALAAVLAVAGLYIGFALAPTDYQQGESYRIIYIHVPAAWMSMFIYVVMAGYGILFLAMKTRLSAMMMAALGLAFNTRLSSMMASALAPTGALFTFLALWTGEIGRAHV